MLMSIDATEAKTESKEEILIKYTLITLGPAFHQKRLRWVKGKAMSKIRTT